MLDDLVGGCIADRPRLSELREIVPAPVFPVCVERDGMWAWMRTPVFYELAGDCDGVLRIVRTECSDPADGFTDIEADY
jgi:hypothetical protein